MELSKIKSKIESVKSLVNELERKSIEIISASAELEYRYKQAINSKNISYQSACELLALERNIDEILKSSDFISPGISSVKEGL